jgi:hypothetical protein
MNLHTDVSARIGALELGAAVHAPDDSAVESQLAAPGGTIRVAIYCPARVGEDAEADAALEAAALTDPHPRPTPAMPVSPACRLIDDAALEKAALEAEPKPNTIIMPPLKRCF